ncbi:MAG: ATP-binding protein [Candidatus Omnitrophica bacterium]|nr:ATP-binding protein [Candidatus Omnitrophota bacterium]
MQIPRFYQNLALYLKPNKALIIYGPRQAGKTTLVKNFLATYQGKYKFDTGDNISIQSILSSQDLAALKEYAQGYDLLVIDEAQKIQNIGQTIKLLIDNIPNLKVIATGSSSFDLAGQIGEPLTGRKVTLTLYPVAQLELQKLYNPYELKNRLEHSLIFGGYPEIVATDVSAEKIRWLEELAQAYLLKDILEFDRVKSAKLIMDLLRLLAFQIGKEVSLAELGQQVGIDHKTVGRYLDLFEKTFVIYSVRGFSRNLRSEIAKKGKYYFYDVGIRNAVISNFNSLRLRNDVGELWENFLFMERLKKRAYQSLYANVYFWRTWEKQEIDLIEEREGKLFAYEFKWGQTQAKSPKQWQQTYPDAFFETINQDNYLNFIAD